MRGEPAKLGKGKTVKMVIRALANGRKAEQTFDMPASLKDAVKIYGEDKVFKMFVDSLVITLQSRVRQMARPEREQPYSWADAIRDKAKG